MPTLSGWGLLAAGACFVVAGRLFGAVEFLVAGIAALAAVVLAVALRWLRPSRLAVSRRLSTPRVPAGARARVDLEVVNRSGMRSPLLVLRDRAAGGAGDDKTVLLSLGPLAGRAGCQGAYLLPTARRGVIDLGPLRVDDVDVLGLARRRKRFDARARLVVHPPVEELKGLVLHSGSDPLFGPEQRQASGMGDEEFEGLREYVPGDDLRKIHWRTSARRDDLQVRQFHPPRHGRLSVVIDTRPPGDHEAALDITTSIAASIAAAGIRSGDTVRVEASDGRRTEARPGTAQLHGILEFLALLSGGDTEIHPVIPDASGTVVAVTADPFAVSDSTVRHRITQRLRADVIVTVDASLWSSPHGSASSVGDWIHLTGPGQLSTISDTRRRRRYGSAPGRPAPDAVSSAIAAG